MPRTNTGAEDVERYIALFPEDVQKELLKMRKAIKKAAPDADETMRYGIPTFRLNGNLVHFAAFKNHLGFYPTPSGIVRFKKELSAFKVSKGSVQFPWNKLIPYGLIAKIVKFRVEENTGRTGQKQRRDKKGG